MDKRSIWQRIVALEGETFRQIRGGEFTYKVSNNALDLDRTNWHIPRSHIEQALDLFRSPPPCRCSISSPRPTSM